MRKIIALLFTVSYLLSPPCSTKGLPSPKDPAVPYVRLYESTIPTPVKSTPKTFGRKFTWTFEGKEYSLVVDVSVEEYNACQGYPHRRGEYTRMVERGRRDLKPVAKEFRRYVERQNWSREKIINFVLSFVQCLPYRTDASTLRENDYPRDAIQTLVDVGNDCEDSSILLASILNGLGFEVALLNPKGHMAVGVAGDFSGSYVPSKGRKFFFCETTGTGWKLGSMPSKYKEEKILVYHISKVKVAPIVSRTIFPEEEIAPPKWIPSLKEIYVVVDKSKHRLYLFNGNRVIKTFKVDTGEMSGPKTREGDRRTPEGRYMIVDMREPDDTLVYGSYFLEINYPNYLDWERGRTGSAIGIHGTKRREVSGSNITDGCIVMDNEDVEEVARLVNVGSPVFIYSSLPERITVAKAPELTKHFGNFIYQTEEGIIRRGKTLTITLRFWDIKEYAEWGEAVFAFREEYFDVPGEKNKVKEIYSRNNFTVVKIEERNWRRGETRDFAVNVIPKRAGRLDYYVRLVLRHSWGFVTYPQYGFFDPTGLPAVFQKIKVERG